jgi:hypothetical protein
MMLLYLMMGLRGVWFRMKVSLMREAGHTMRARHLIRGMVLALCLSIGLLLGTAGMSAYGLEVPEGVQEARIPVTLPVEAPIAGGEVEFSQTTGLQYLGFEPANGIKNPVKASVEGKNYVGFFSADNEYQPATNGLLMGNLVFRYTGDAAEQVTLSKIKLHTKVDTDAGTRVSTQVVNPGTVIPVNRPSDGTGGEGSGGEGEGGGTGGGEGNGGGGTGGGEGGGGTGGGSNNGGGSAGGGTNNGGGTGGAGTGGGGTGTGGAAGGGGGGTGGTGTGTGAVVDATGAPSGSTGTDTTGSTGSTGSPGSTGGPSGTGGVGIEDAAVPLVAPVVNGQAFPLWLMWVLAAFALLILALLALFLFKRRRQEEEAIEEGFGKHMKDIEGFDRIEGFDPGDDGSPDNPRSEG